MSERAEAVLVRAQTGEFDDDLAPVLVELAAASVDIAVTGLRSAAVAARRLGRATSGSLIVADAARALLVDDSGTASATDWEPGSRTFDDWWTERLWRSGITPGSIERLDGTTAVLADRLATQLRLRAELSLPLPHSEPGWTVDLGPFENDGRPRVQPSLLTLSAGTAATIGDPDSGSDGSSDGSTAFVLAAGAYGLGHDGLVRPLPGPTWTRLGHPPPDGAGAARWTLDLRAGVLRREPVGEGARSIRFMSLDRPGLGGLRAERRAPATWPDPLDPPVAPRTLSADYRCTVGRHGSTTSAATTSDRTTVAVSARQRAVTTENHSRLERISVTRAGDPTCTASADADVDEAGRIGFDRLLSDHRRAWGERWEHADIEITGDPDAQLAVRFALFHLLSCASVDGEATVGARGLTGLAYAGHVFWDTDVFVLPTLVATLPAAARAVLEYRIRRLDAARHEASQRGRPGARFPWESADTGADVTPRSVVGVDGEVVPILTGSHEEHITSDVAWAALHYVDWTGDRSVIEGPGRGLVTETAEYWADRVRVDDRGRRHIDDVMGPDEYHAVVDDNAYTNLMTRWHLRQAAVMATEDGDRTRADELMLIADSLVDGYDPATRRHEQFSGFWDLEPVMIDEIAEPPVAADVLLGHERIARTQLVKQPDVLMAHHLIPDELAAGSLAADLDVYLPRTAHGSSLSPAICAALLARAGRPDEALPLFDLAARLDLDDLTRTTSGGLHLATMGGLWQAVVSGFAGIRPVGDVLRIDPHLPSRWSSLRIRIVFRGHPVVVTVTGDAITVDADDDVDIDVPGSARTVRRRRPPPTDARSAP